jgi:predicted component of type VI protein secretion system
MTGPAGTGKTLLSEVTAREVACNLHTDLAHNIRTPEHVHGALQETLPDAFAVRRIAQQHDLLEHFRAILGGGAGNLGSGAVIDDRVLVDDWHPVASAQQRALRRPSGARW